MSRDALPPVPSVIGTPAEYTSTTFARQWEERRETWVERPHPTPVQRALDVDPGAACVPKDARKMALHASGLAGLVVTVRHAIGYAFDPKTGEIKMRNVMAFKEPEEWTEGTEKRKPVRKREKVGEVASPPEPSIRVVVRHAEWNLAGFWLNGAWNAGTIVSRDNLVRNVGWRELWDDLQKRTCLLPRPSDGTLFECPEQRAPADRGRTGTTAR